jgi:hypothetical protein
MKEIFYWTFNFTITLLFVSILVGCDQPPKFSDDIEEFQRIVDIGHPQTAVRWEIFDSPEQTGLQVGPAGDTILIAEFTPLDVDTFSRLPAGGVAGYAPEAGRPWLDEAFRTLFEKQVGRSIDLSPSTNCRSHRSLVKRFNKYSKGIICHSGNKGLIYHSISTETLK